MEAYFALLIPIFFSIIAFIIWHKKLTWWEVILPTLIGLFFIFGTKSCMESSNLADTEYLSTYAIQTVYEEPWNEYIHKTCTREYACGTETTTDSKGNTHSTTKYCTETYDCSYVDYHPAQYYIICQNKESYSISKEKYDELVKKWGNNKFVEMNRNYYTQDGDEYVSDWKGDIKTVETADWTQSYENKIQSSHSIYNYEDISDLDKKEYKLYEYPNSNSYKINSILSSKSYIFQYEQDQINAINGLLGAAKKIHIWVLIFEESNKYAAELQQSYWKGGNKNELVICIGVDKKRHIKWNHVFTWSDKQIVKIKIRNYLNKLKGQRLEFINMQPFLYQEINKDWVKKNWHDFDFLQPELTDSQLHWLYVIVIIMSLGSITFGVLNEFENDGNFNEINKKSKIKYNINKKYSSVMDWIREKTGRN